MRSRRGSAVSSGSKVSAASESVGSPSVGHMGSQTPPKVNEFGKQRTQSFNADNAMQHAMNSVDPAMSPSLRPRADSYQVNDPIPEVEKF